MPGEPDAQPSPTSVRSSIESGSPSRAASVICGPQPAGSPPASSRRRCAIGELARRPARARLVRGRCRRRTAPSSRGCRTRSGGRSRRPACGRTPRPSRRAAVDAAVDDQAPPMPVPRVDAHDEPVPAPGAEAALRRGGGVGVVVDDHRQPHPVGHGVAERLVPPGQVGREHDHGARSASTKPAAPMPTAAMSCAAARTRDQVDDGVLDRRTSWPTVSTARLVENRPGGVDHPGERPSCRRCRCRRSAGPTATDASAAGRGRGLTGGAAGGGCRARPRPRSSTGHCASLPSAISRMVLRRILPGPGLGQAADHASTSRTPRPARSRRAPARPARARSSSGSASTPALSTTKPARHLALELVGDPDHRALGHRRVRGEHRLHRAGREPVPGHVDDVVGAAHDVQVAVLVEVARRRRSGSSRRTRDRYDATYRSSSLPQRRQRARRQRQPDADRALLAARRPRAPASSSTCTS